jgi:ABC-type multidrug transport system fused ATPase/permease subunit
VLVAAVLGLLANAGGLAQPLVAAEVIQRLEDDVSLLTPVVALLVLMLLSAAIAGAQLWMLDRAAERIARRARVDLAQRILALRMADLDRLTPGDLMARVTSDTTLLRAATTSGVVDTFNGSITVVATAVLMAVLDWPLLLVTLGILFTLGVGIGIVLPRLRRAATAAQVSVGQLGAVLERALGSIRTVKTSGAEQRELGAIASAADAAYRQGLIGARLMALVGVSTGLAVQMSFLAVLGVGGGRVASGAMEVSTLIAFLLYLFYLAEPIAALSNGVTRFQSGLAAAGRIEELNAFAVEQGTQSVPLDELPAISGRPALVVFERVHFSYRPDRLVLRDVSFTVPACAQTAIVGPSGAGKTTLFALLERLYDVDAGAIRLDGRDIREMPIGALRSQIGYVEQEAPVLAGSLRDNLCYAKPDATDDELLDALQDTQLTALVAQNGLDTQVGTRGIRLSGGERQRIAIARALVRKPKLLLLDEVTAQLDAVNEQALRLTIERAATRCAVIVIAHRLSTVTSAAQIVVLDQGRVRARGTHNELVQRDSLYRLLAQTQLIASAVD